MTLPWTDQVVGIVLEYLAVFALSPLLLALGRIVKARSQGRRGPPLLQVYRDLWKLLGKQAIYSDTASGLTRYAPTVSFVALLAGVPLIPWLFLPTPLGYVGDL
ncbi:formate hydrogenlyase subunit 4, partial [mine drainage metagenome]